MASEGNNYPSLPWQEQLAVDTEVADFNSPGDFVVKLMNYEFQAKATTVVFSNLAKVHTLMHHALASSMH